MSGLDMDSDIARAFIANSAEAICVIDQSGQIIESNEKLAQILELSKSFALGRKADELFPMFASSPLKDSLEGAFKGTAQICDTAFSPNNGKAYFKVSFSPIEVEKTNNLVIAIFREVDKEGPSGSESRFRPLIEESPIATAIYSPCGTPRYFNRAYGAIWGAESRMAPEIIDKYNIFDDEQLVEIGVMPFIQKAFAGERCEIPPIPYTPAKTHSIKHLGLNEQKYVKGSIFPIKNKMGALEEVVLVLTDITFQKKSEQILTDTHLKLQMLTTELPGIIYEYRVKPNGQSKFKYISERCEDIFGITSEEAVKNENLLIDAIHPDDLDSFISSSTESNKAFKEWHWEGRIVVKGKIKWIEGKSSPVKSKKGGLLRYGFLLDITDKKEVEAQYKLTEERLQLALRGAEIGLWEWDTKRRRTIFNKNWAKKFGYAHEEVEKKFEDWAGMVHPNDLADVKKKLSEHLTGKTDHFEAEYRLLTKAGSYRWILDKGRAVEKNERGIVTKASGTYLDINDKKNSELLIKRNEKLFTQLFDNSPLGIVMLNENHKVVEMNKGFENIFGYSKKEIVGNKLNNIIVPEDLSQEAMDINVLTASGKVGKLESIRKSKRGVMIPVLIYGVPVSLDNQTIGIYGIYVDITHRKKTEKELQIRNNELDNFVYKVSHDLRAPLSSILGLINLANHEKNEDDIREYISIIENRVRQLDNFINDVLSHSKNLKLAISVEKINFKEVIEKCFDSLSYLPKASAVQREVKINDSEFYSDKWRINEIFRNLISNAIKYLNQEAETPFIKIDIDVTEKAAIIVLEDNGIGIEKSTLPKVFEMFFRATEHSEGSGIGLYIVKNAVDKLGGEVSVKSKQGKGTRFKLVIPNNQEEQSNMSD